MNRLQHLHEAGVSIWLDTLWRQLLESGEFATLVDKYAVSEATSNPTIFAQAITGSDRYDKQLRSLDLAGGKSWHNNHHAFPTSAFHGLRRRELDLGGLFIRLLESLGLAWQVVRVSPERQQARRAAGQVAVDRHRSGAPAQQSFITPRLETRK